jgi:hypothetical protein
MRSGRGTFSAEPPNTGLKPAAGRASGPTAGWLGRHADKSGASFPVSGPATLMRRAGQPPAVQTFPKAGACHGERSLWGRHAEGNARLRQAAGWPQTR